MKKTIALLMALALLISALAVPALAEETAGTVDQVTSATTQSGQTGRNGNSNNNSNSNGQQMPGRNNRMPGNGQMPRMPGNGQMPQMPGQGSQSGQLPQAPAQNGQDSQNGQASQLPGKGSRNSRQANQAGRAGKQSVFDQLLADGVITQEVYDAITAWMSEKAAQPLQDTAAAAGSTEQPALSAGTPEAPASAQAELLKSLLDSGAITQEQYDLLLSAIPAVPAGQPAEQSVEQPAT